MKLDKKYQIEGVAILGEIEINRGNIAEGKRLLAKAHEAFCKISDKMTNEEFEQDKVLVNIWKILDSVNW